MGNEIACLMATKYQIFFARGALSPYNPLQGRGVGRHQNFEFQCNSLNRCLKKFQL